MTIYTVTTASEFNQAIAGAQAGDRLEIAAANLSNLSIGSKNFSGAGITITAASGYDPVIEIITVSNSSGITFQDLTFFRTTGNSWDNAATFTNCHDITVNGCDIHSSIDSNYNNDKDGLEFAGGYNLTISNNEFTNVGIGVYVRNADNVTVSNNTVHDLGGDAFDFNNIRNSQITGNLGYGWGLITGQHRDFIQFWTDTSYTQSQYVTISGNVLLSPTESVQGIFVESDTSQGFDNFSITQNLIITENAHGIVVAPATNTTISYNTIVPAYGNSSAGRISVDDEPNYTTNKSSNVTVTNNITAGVDITSTGSNNTQSGNAFIQFSNPNNSSYAGDLFLDALSGSNVNDLRPVPGSSVSSGVGATDPYTTAGAPVAYISASQSNAPNQAMTPTFTAVDWDGSVPNGTTYAWDFGDGVTSEGATASHRFSAQGQHTVSLTVTTPGSGSVTVDKIVDVRSPVLLETNFETDPAYSNSSSAQVTDSSPNARVGNWVSGSPATTDSAADIYVAGPGGTGLAANFDNATSEIKFSNSADFNGLKQFTMTLDLNIDQVDSSSQDRVIWKAGVFGIEVQANNKLKVYLYTGSGSGTQYTLQSTSALTTDTWHSVTVVFDGLADTGAQTGSLSLYVDGTLAANSITVGTSLVTNTNDVYFGGSGSSTRFMDGAIDNVRFLAGAYTPTQVGTLNTYLNNSAPTNVLLSGDGVYERVADGTVVGALSTVDNGDTATYSLAPGSSPYFAISGSNLVVVGESLDYETATTHNVIVRATDSAGNVRQQTIAVQMKDALEFPLTGGGDMSGTSGDDMVFGGSGNDRYVGGAGADTMNGGAGYDEVDYSGSSAAIIVDMANPAAGSGDAAGDAFNSVERITGTDYADAMSGNSSSNNLGGGLGADTLDGHGGADSIFGGGGDDVITGGTGADYMQGSSGSDTYVFNPGEAQGDQIVGFAGNGSAAGDILKFVGYGGGATLSNSGDMWTITWTGGSETFQLTGVTGLDPSDYLFI